MIVVESLRTPDDAPAFRRLNEEWIRAYFTLEDKDRETLADPVGTYVAPGGDVLIARDTDGTAVGCAALEPLGDGVFELSKMCVTPSMRGLGAGRVVIDAALARARELGARRVFLGSNRRLKAAVGLYESVGFRHVGRDEIGPLPYSRADVFMALDLPDGYGRSGSTSNVRDGRTSSSCAAISCSSRSPAAAVAASTP